MSTSVDELNDKIVGKGGLLVTMYFDIHGNSPEIIQNSMVDMIGRLTKEVGVAYATGQIEKPIEYEGMHSTCAEVKLLVKDLNSLISVCFRYGPIGIDLLRPQDVKLTIPQLHEILLNVSQISQEYSQFMYNKVMTPEDKVNFNKQLINRAELAKKIIEKGKEKK
jgi:hypothetical protein